MDSQDCSSMEKTMFEEMLGIGPSTSATPVTPGPSRPCTKQKEEFNIRQISLSDSDTEMAEGGSEMDSVNTITFHDGGATPPSTSKASKALKGTHNDSGINVDTEATESMPSPASTVMMDKRDWRSATLVGACPNTLGAVQFLVQFEPAKGQKMRPPELIPASVCNVTIPLKVIKFYESRMEFAKIDKTSGAIVTGKGDKF